MTAGTREVPVNSSPAVAANAEGEEIEVLESTDVLPVAMEDVSQLKMSICSIEEHRTTLCGSLFPIIRRKRHVMNITLVKVYHF